MGLALSSGGGGGFDGRTSAGEENYIFVILLFNKVFFIERKFDGGTSAWEENLIFLIFIRNYCCIVILCID